jgi:alkanesulfonate monooxygenase SsuD/methylene tetrahydromethanopterin reductase-like flavin-dependent oxidoreductase (luciferase family)
VSPRGPVPLLVGVKGEQALAIAARHADEWNLWGLPDTVREKGRLLDTSCEAQGRDPSEIRRTAQALLCLTGGRQDLDTERWRAAKLPMLIGGPAELRDALGEYVAAGLDELIIPDFTLGDAAQKRDTLDLFLAEVAADFRESSPPPGQSDDPRS